MTLCLFKVKKRHLLRRSFFRGGGRERFSELLAERKAFDLSSLWQSGDAWNNIPVSIYQVWKTKPSAFEEMKDCEWEESGNIWWEVTRAPHIAGKVCTASSYYDYWPAQFRYWGGSGQLEFRIFPKSHKDGWIHLIWIPLHSCLTAFFSRLPSPPPPSDTPGLKRGATCFVLEQH